MATPERLVLALATDGEVTSEGNKCRVYSPGISLMPLKTGLVLNIYMKNNSNTVGGEQSLDSGRPVHIPSAVDLI